MKRAHRMRPDILDLQAFYDSRQGQLARRLVARQVRALWPDVAGSTVVGVGYAAPFLEVLAEDARCTLALMPSSQGAAPWPQDAPCRVALVREDELPLPDRSVDRLICVHALETARRLDRFLRETWRVLADGGRMIAIVPNRRGLWCLSERTPFGHGQPFSAGQLEKALTNHLLTPTGTRRALYVPPLGASWLLRAALPMERLGLRFAPTFSGLLVVEAEKRIMVGTPIPVRASKVTARRYAPVPSGLAAAREAHEDEPVSRDRPGRSVPSAARGALAEDPL